MLNYYRKLSLNKGRQRLRPVYANPGEISCNFSQPMGGTHAGVLSGLLKFTLSTRTEEEGFVLLRTTNSLDYYSITVHRGIYSTFSQFQIIITFLCQNCKGKSSLSVPFHIFFPFKNKLTLSSKSRKNIRKTADTWNQAITFNEISCNDTTSLTSSTESCMQQ